MSPSTLATEVRRANETTTIIDVRGDITAQSEDVLMEAYAQAGDATKTLILNFGGLEYMNSGGIGLIVTLLVRVNRQKQKLLAYGLTEHYRQIFELTRLDEAIGIEPDEASALAAAEGTK